MTATRWWVKRLARWIARVNGIRAHIQMVSLAVTAFSTFSIMLQGFGLGHLVLYLGVAGLAGGIVYTYYYTEGGVWNQVNLDRQELSGNWLGPNGAIQAEANMRAWLAAQKGRELTDEERDAIRAERQATVTDLRDGIDLDD